MTALPMMVTVVVGNPRAASRTMTAAIDLAEQATGRYPDHVIDLAELGAGILDRSDPALVAAVAAVRSSRHVVVASPTYKATYTGLLKLFLEQFGSGELAGIIAFPLMLGGDRTHALAVEAHLRPVLAEIGLSTSAGLFLVDAEGLTLEAYDAWVRLAAPLLPRT